MRAPLLISLFMSGHLLAAPMSGVWETPKRNGANFSVELIANGKLVCGQVTAISGQRVDASWIVGALTKAKATVEFSTMFNEKDTRGKATLSWKGNHLEWHVIKDIDGGWIWDSAKVFHRPWEPKRQRFITDWCDNQWKYIKEGNVGSINLQP